MNVHSEKYEYIKLKIWKKAMGRVSVTPHFYSKILKTGTVFWDSTIAYKGAELYITLDYKKSLFRS